jgi:diketogulonate reductase-like aldo/keto reductase
MEAGQGVARAIKDGLVKREELFIVSKIWNTFHEKERVEEACLKSLTDWGLDYFDLYIMHFRTDSQSFQRIKSNFDSNWSQICLTSDSLSTRLVS